MRYTYNPLQNDVSCTISRWKGQDHTGHSKFLPCPLGSSVPISPIHFICSTQTIHNKTMCHAPFPGQQIKGQVHPGLAKFLVCPLRGSVSIWQLHILFDAHTTHEGTLCHAPLWGQKSRWHGSVEVYAMSAPWLHPYFTDSLHMWHAHNPWRYDVSRTISRSKGQSHMRHWKFLLL